MISKDGQLWLEGYQGEEVMLLDDFRGQVPLTEVLRLTHEYRSRQNVKGTSCDVNPAIVVFTSNYHYNEFWPSESKEPLERRITDHFILTSTIPSKPFGVGSAAVRRIRSGAYVQTVKGHYDDVLEDPPAEGEPGRINDDEVEAIVTAELPKEGWLPAARPPKKIRNEPGEDSQLVDTLASLVTEED